jgi:carbonic anhydrase/acetyltransferase-like protein (isoleucine patch superfamily)
MTIYSFEGAEPTIPAGEAWVAPNATVIGNVRFGKDVSVWFGAVLRGDNDLISIGDRSNIQDLTMIHVDPGHPVSVGANCTVGHRAILHGCTIGDNSLIGMGAIVLNGAVIGRNCLVGAGALVAEGKVIPDNSLVLGMPGKVARELGESDFANLTRAADHYVDKWKRFASGAQVLSER